MRIRVFRTPLAAARALARELVGAVAANPRLVLGLPAGNTPILVYHELAALAAIDQVDFSRVTTFNLDEFAGLPASDPRSYRAFMRRHFFNRLERRPRRIHMLNGAAPDSERECARYERAIAGAGGIDLQLLGLGRNGHIGFNEPAASLTARTHRTRLTPATRRANATLFGNRSRSVPREGLSMGMATILHARRIVLLATGREKASSVAKLVEGRVTPRVPASMLQLHAHVEVWLDRAAAERL